MVIESVVDLLLCLTILILCCGVFLVKGTFTSIILFISFGLTITLAWIRLGAVDIAIAEAAIGAGVTGALLLAAWKKSVQKSTGKEDLDV